MPWTNFPNGVSVTTATGSAIGTVNATSVISVGITAANGSYKGQVCRLAIGTAAAQHDTLVVTSTGTAHNSSITCLAPFTGYAEIQVYNVTAARAVTYTVHADSVTTGTTICTYATSLGANGIGSSIGAVTVTKGSYICLKQAAAGSDGSASVCVNLIKS